MAKPGDRVLMRSKDLGEATLIAVPTNGPRGYDGLVALDRPIGHTGDANWSCLESLVDPKETDFKLLREWWDRAMTGDEHLWWVHTTGSFTVIEPELPKSGHVPGLHTCSKGCGFMNDYADASAFATGKYVCFQCSLWARKCEW